MTWAGRLKLFVGVLVVLAIVAGCTLIFTQRQSAAQSASATIEAESFTVGAVYAGTVVDQLVQPGDDVTQGQPLLVVHSVQLVRDLEDEVETPTELDGVDPAFDRFDHAGRRLTQLHGAGRGDPPAPVSVARVSLLAQLAAEGEGDGAENDETDRTMFTLGVTRSLSPNTSGSLTYRHIKSEGDDSYTENAVTAVLGMRF